MLGGSKLPANHRGGREVPLLDDTTDTDVKGELALVKGKWWWGMQKTRPTKEGRGRRRRRRRRRGRQLSGVAASSICPPPCLPPTQKWCLYS